MGEALCSILRVGEVPVEGAGRLDRSRTDGSYFPPVTQFAEETPFKTPYINHHYFLIMF